MRLAILGGRFGIVDEHLSGYRVSAQVRQCTTIRDRLPDDFSSKIYGELYDFAIQKNVLTPNVTQAFAETLRRDALYYIKKGKFKAAINCMESRFEISGTRSWNGVDFRSSLAMFNWHCIYFLDQMKIILKKFFM